jgi:hypothetical protein
MTLNFPYVCYRLKPCQLDVLQVANRGSHSSPDELHELSAGSKLLSPTIYIHDINLVMSLMSDTLFPHDDNVVFAESSYFLRFEQAATLPSPEDVRTRSREANPGLDRVSRPPPAIYPERSLVVKFGSEVTIAEGQCLVAIRKLLSPRVPVPEVFGWRRDGIQTFIYLEWIHGDSLEKSWATLTEEQRLSICHQLRYMVDTWRNLKQDSSQPFIGTATATLQNDLSNHSRARWWTASLGYRF